MKTLTENQQYVIDTLIERGAEWVASSIKTSWQKGETNYIDKRVRAGKGLMRKMNQGNKEAVQ